MWTSAFAAIAIGAFLGAVGSASAIQAPKLLHRLTVSKEKNVGYERDKFAPWIDANGNGCDTRDEVLYRQNRAHGKHCGDDKGKWVSAYDGVHFNDASDLDIDHMVPLAEAWGSGARTWKPYTRERYANDLYGYDLIAVSASSNRSKGDSDPAEWLPPKASYVCRYDAHWVAVKYRWKLTIDKREKRAISKRFKRCSSSSLKVTKTKQANVKQSKLVKPSDKPKHPSGGGGTDPRFGTCAEAIDHGYGPYYRGRDKEYGWYRDADSDGVVCEK